MPDSPVIKTTWTWEEWQASRAERRAVSRTVSAAPIRRLRSSSDRRLRRLFDGQRGPAFNKDTATPS